MKYMTHIVMAASRITMALSILCIDITVQAQGPQPSNCYPGQDVNLPGTCKMANIEILLMIDQAFVAKNGGDVAAARLKALEVFDKMKTGEGLVDETGLQEALMQEEYTTAFTLINFTNDIAPNNWANTGQSAWAQRIRDYWNAPEKYCIKRDLIVFLTGQDYGFAGVHDDGGGNVICQPGIGGSQHVIIIQNQSTPEITATTMAHEIMHSFGLGHLDDLKTDPDGKTYYATFCHTECGSGSNALMCKQSDEIRFTSCDRLCLGQFFDKNKCACLQKTFPVFPDNYTCPLSDNMALAILVDNLNPVRGCYPGGDEVVFTVHLLNNSQQANRNIRAVINEANSEYAEFVVEPAYPFNCIKTITGGSKEFRITTDCTANVESTFPMGPNEVKTFQFKVRYKKNLPNNFQGGANTFAVMIYSGSSVNTTLVTQVKYLEPFFDITGGKLSDLIKNDQWEDTSPLFIKGDVFLDNVNVPTYTSEKYNFGPNKKLLFAPGTGLTVANTLTTMNQVEARGCQQMWKGITIAYHAEFQANKSIIEDAQAAITANKGSKVSIQNTELNNNDIGIRTYPGIGAGTYAITLLGNKFRSVGDGLKPPYPGQYPVPGALGYAGLSIQNVTGLIIDADPVSKSPNEFSNLRMGIIADNSTLTVKYTQFNDISYAQKAAGYPGPSQLGNAIYATNNCYLDVQGAGVDGDNYTVTVDNATIGILAEKSTVRARRCDMQHVGTGIHVKGGLMHGLKLTANRIDAKGQGIFVNTQSGTPSASRIDSNTVTVHGAVSQGITLLNNRFLMPAHDTYVFHNRVTVNEGLAGVFVSGNTRTQVTDNKIALQPAHSDGIKISGGTRNALGCNEISGAGRRGIYGLMASATNFQCNTADGTDYGIYLDGVFTGDVPKIFLGDNTMKNNTTAGLLLGSNALIGEQVHTGNRWSNSGGLTVARHLGGQIAGNSKFIVDANENSEFLPIFIDPGSWFLDENNPLSSFICNSSTDCPLPAPFVGQGDELDRLTAKGQLSGFEYQAYSLWLTQKRLYQRLTYEGNPHMGDLDFNNFLNSNPTTTVGTYAALQQSLQNLFIFPADEWTALDATEAAISQNLEELGGVEQDLARYGLDQQDSVLLEVNRSSIRTQLEQMTGDQAIRRGAIQDNRISAVFSLLSQNSNLSATEPYEVNEKKVNDIFLNTLAQGIISFTEVQQSDLQTIAAMCPLADGEAVLYARTLLALARGEYVQYDDSTACGGILPREKRAGQTMQSGILIYPSPSHEKLCIQYTLTDEKPVVFLMFNAMGQLVEERHLTDMMGTVNLNTSGLQNGIYFYFVGKSAMGKVVIQH